ncbi:MAG: hypothetical protein DWQ01_05960 [Planctomycetota bacterium]|nr:MAG: hypothetical protein DWQ01_05960 [Planctomycetota bacterium]
MARSLSLLWLVLLVTACNSPQFGSSDFGNLASSQDPKKAEVLLSQTGSWQAMLLLDNGETGVWTVKSFPIFPQYAVPEVVGLDDKGKCHVLVSYSGKWTPIQVVHDGRWLGGLTHGDVDPRYPGAELYTGGQNGNLYQLRSYPQGALDGRLIAYLPGREIHTLLAGDLDPENPGKELLVFTRPGGLFLLTPTGEHGGFETRFLGDLPGRVRDALVLNPEGGDPEIITVSRAGRIQSLKLRGGSTHWRELFQTDMGMGRVARKPGTSRDAPVLYATLDDGRILRLERQPAGDWQPETIFKGHQGPRGIAAGRFDADKSKETVAIFGYSGKVELLSRNGDGWTSELLFQDRDKGHWLAAAELDGRNDTEEILLSGYGSRIVMLVQEP